MAEVEDLERPAVANAANTANDRGAARPRKLQGARRLLVASIGAATVNYAVGCETGERLSTFVANLMAPPAMPLDRPPFVPDQPSGSGGSGGQGGAAGASGDAGVAGASGDADAGADDDAGGPP